MAYRSAGRYQRPPYTLHLDRGRNRAILVGMPDQLRRASFKVVGGEPLCGKIHPQGNKNEALPILAASILTAEPLLLRNVPDIHDVRVMLRLLEALGVTVERIDQDSTLRVTCGSRPASEIPLELAGRLRGSVTLAGPLLARTGKALLPKPGGDRIGRRRLDTHLLGLAALGARFRALPYGFLLETDGLRGADILLDEASVTATENIIAAAVLAEGETVLRNAASEPHVQAMCRMLVRMGAKIDGIGTNLLRVRGVNDLGGAEHAIGPDYLEVGSFISLAAVTRGELVIEDVVLEDLRMIRFNYDRLGIKTVEKDGALLVPREQPMIVRMDQGGAIPEFDDAPWPGFPADMTSVALVTATQCEGTVLIHEKMFESRLFFTDNLIQMGARIVLCDPHRAVVTGREQLHGARVASPDIRAGMAMLIAALCAEGESEIQNVDQIDRGFTRIDQRLRELGARIERTS